MTQYPLLFARRELVEGNGFVAGVAVSGRALLTEEDGEVWVEGINPGGFDAEGKSHGEALTEFCSAFKAILFDIADEAQDFARFEAEVQRFFNDTNTTALREWEAALRQVRAGQLNADWLQKRSAETQLTVKVVEVRQPTATNNDLGVAALALAA
jgi:hypothetical protein